MLECVINVSEGARDGVVDAIAAAGGPHLLDVHRDRHHNRSVLTLAGPGVEDAARAVAAAAVERIDLRQHHGVHPRLGAVDVVPFVPLAGSTMDDALAARDAFAGWIAAELGVPAFVYGPEHSLPDVRRHAFVDLAPAAGPPEPHPTAGAVAVGARGVLIAYNLFLTTSDVATARAIAAAIRSPSVRALGLDVGGVAQVSCNLVDPDATGPADAYDLVAERAPVARAELVGLLPSAVLDAIEPSRWAELDVGPSRTIEARLEQAGLDGGSDGGATSGRGR